MFLGLIGMVFEESAKSGFKHLTCKNFFDARDLVDASPCLISFGDGSQCSDNGILANSKLGKSLVI